MHSPVKQNQSIFINLHFVINVNCFFSFVFSLVFSLVFFFIFCIFN